MTSSSNTAMPWITMYACVLPGMILGVTSAEFVRSTPREPFTHVLEGVATQIVLGPSLLAALVVAIHPTVTRRLFRTRSSAGRWPSVLSGAVLGLVAGLVWQLVVPFGLIALVVGTLGGAAFGILAPAHRLSGSA